MSYCGHLSFSLFLASKTTSAPCLESCIAMALPINQGKGAKLLGNLTYHSGRIITYSMIGAVMGGVGQGLAIMGIQQSLSILIGAIILISVFTPSAAG